jgi:hypothetical protein
MNSPLTAAGAISEPSRSAPLHTNRFFTGLWTHRNPLRDAAVPFLYEKFYGGTRFDSLIDGLNTEVTSRLTMARRYGHSVYNSQTFPAINRFYQFNIFGGAAQIIKVIADTATQVYDATGPNTKTLLFTKSAGAGSSYFQSVGNILYFGNGKDQKKWVQTAKAWAAATQFQAGDYLVDTSNNLQLCVGLRSANISTIAINANVLTHRVHGEYHIPAWDEPGAGGIHHKCFLEWSNRPRALSDAEHTDRDLCSCQRGNDGRHGYSFDGERTHGRGAARVVSRGQCSDD